MATREALISRLEEFADIGYKIAQLMIIWFQSVLWKGFGKKELAMLQSIPAIPVDIHCLRLSYQLGVISMCQRDHRDDIGWPLSTIYSQVCEELGISHIDLTQGFWRIGSSYCDRACRLIGYQRAKHCHLCPVRQFCNGIVAFNKESTRQGRVGFKNLEPHQNYPFLEQLK